MIKGVYNILRAYFKQHTKAQIKIHKSKLLIYDEHLQKYVSAEELLIPAEPKKGKQALRMNRSREFLLFDLLLKKFVNPKLDLLTPGIKNTKQLTRINDFRIQHENCNTYSTDFFWGNKKRSNKHVPALPAVHDKKSYAQDGSSKMGWAGQVTSKPNSDPRPEHSNTSCFVGPGKDPKQEKPQKKKDKGKLVCKKENKRLDQPIDETVNIAESKNTGSNVGMKSISKNSEFQEEFCFPTSKKETKTSLQHQNTDKSSNNHVKPDKQEKKESRSSKKESKSVFKKLCSQFFPRSKAEDSCHKLKTSESKNTTKEKVQNKKSNKPCEQTTIEIPTKNSCESKDKKFSKIDQDPYTKICPPKPPGKAKQDTVLDDNQEVGIEKICNSNVKEDACVKPSVKSKSIDSSKNKITQTQCSHSSKNQSSEKPKITERDQIKLATEKECLEKTSMKSCVDLSPELMIKECKKSIVQGQTCSPKKKDSQDKGSKQCSSKPPAKVQCIKESSKYDFMVRPKTCNLQKIQAKKDVTENKAVTNKECTSSQEIQEKTCLKELNFIKQTSISSGNYKICNYLDRSSATNIANEKSSENKKPCTKSEKKQSKYACREQNVKNSPSVPQISTKKTKSTENKKSRRKSKEKTCKGTKEAVKGSSSAPQLSGKKTNKYDKEETIKNTTNKKLKCVSKTGSEPGLTKSANVDKMVSFNTVGDVKKCKEVQESQKKEGSKTKNPPIKSIASSTVQCQHMETGVTEKLQSITRDKCFEKAQNADLNKVATYMGFKIKKSTLDAKQTKTSSKKGSRTKCSMSKPKAKGAEKTKNKDTCPKEQIDCDKPKVSHQDIKNSKSKQCLKKYSGSEQENKGKCTKKKKAPKDSCQKKSSSSKLKPEIKKDELCSGKLESEKSRNCCNQDSRSQQSTSKSRNCKRPCSQPVSKSIDSKVQSKEITNVAPRVSPIAEQCAPTTAEICSSKKRNDDPDEPCEIQEDKSLLNDCKELSDCCKLNSTVRSSDSTNESQPLVPAPSDNGNIISDENCASTKDIESEKCDMGKLHAVEDQVESDEKSCEERHNSVKSSVNEMACTSPNQDIENQTSISKVVTEEKKNEKQVKPTGKSKIPIKHSKLSKGKKMTLKYTKSCDSYERSASETPKKSKSAIICTSSSDKSPNRKLKKYQPYSKASTNNNKKDGVKKQLHKTKSSIDLSKNQYKLDGNANNQPSNKQTKINKKEKLVKKRTVCSQSTPNLTTTKHKITPGTKISSNKTHKTHSCSMSNMSQSTVANKVELQTDLNSKSNKICSIQTLNKRATENRIIPSKGVEVKSFSDLKSANSPEVNKLTVGGATKELWRIQSHVNVKTDKKLANLKKDQLINNHTMNVEQIAPKYDILQQMQGITKPVTSEIKDVSLDRFNKTLQGKPSLKHTKDKVFQKQLRKSPYTKLGIGDKETKPRVSTIHKAPFGTNDKFGLQIKNVIISSHLENKSEPDSKQITFKNKRNDNVNKTSTHSGADCDKKKTTVTKTDQINLSSGLNTDKKVSKDFKGNIININQVEKDTHTYRDKSTYINNRFKETTRHKSISKEKNSSEKSVKNELLNQLQAKGFSEQSNEAAVHIQPVNKGQQNVDTKQEICRKHLSSAKHTSVETRRHENIERLKNNTSNTKQELKNAMENAPLIFDHATPLKKAEYKTEGKSKNSSEKKSVKQTIENNLFKTMIVSKIHDTCSLNNYKVAKTKIDNKPSSALEKTQYDSYTKNNIVKIENPTVYFHNDKKSKLKSMYKNKTVIKNKEESRGFMPNNDSNDILKLALSEKNQINNETGVKELQIFSYNNYISTHSNKLVDSLEGSNINRVVDLKPLNTLVVDKRLKKIVKKDPLLRNRKHKQNTSVNEKEKFGIKNRLQNNPNSSITQNDSLTNDTLKRNRNIQSKTYVVKSMDLPKESKTKKTLHDVKNRALTSDNQNLDQSTHEKRKVPLNYHSNNQPCSVNKPTKRNITAVPESLETTSATLLACNNSPQAINAISQFKTQSLKRPKVKHIPPIKK